MKDTFDLQDLVFFYLKSDSEMINLLGLNVNDDEQLNNKLKREKLDMSLITPDKLNFITFTIVDSKRSRHYLTNNGLFEFEIYASTRFDAMNIYRRIKEVLNNNFDDMQVLAEAQIPSGIDNVFCYKVRFSPLVSS